MQLAFLRPTGLLEKAMARGKDHWHTELAFSNGDRFTSRPHGGTGWGSLGKAEHYDLLPVPVMPEQEAVVRAWCMSQQGLPYDWAGHMDLAGACRPGHWYCTNVCMVALQQVGLYPGVNACGYHPDSLMALTEKLYGSIVSSP